MCSYDVRFDPLPRSRATSLTRLRPCTNFTLGTYGFPVLASCFLSGHANNTNYNALLFFASLSTRFSLFLAPPAFPSLCRSIYLRSRILGVHTRIRVCAPARSPLSHPSFLFPLSRDMYGFTQTLHSGGRVQIFSTPCLYVFHASLNSSLLAFFFVCFFFFLHYYLNFEILMQSLI